MHSIFITFMGNYLIFDFEKNSTMRLLSKIHEEVAKILYHRCNFDRTHFDSYFLRWFVGKMNS